MQVREILKVSLGIARDVPILRVKRAHTGEFYIQLIMIVLVPYLLLSYTVICLGSNVRGAKPVTVYFGKYEDKEEVLRQAGNIFFTKTKKMNIIHYLTQSKELKNHKKRQYFNAC